MDKHELENRLIRFSVMIIEAATKNPNSKIVNHKSLIHYIKKSKSILAPKCVVSIHP